MKTLSLDELNEITLRVSEILTARGIDGYQYNEPMNSLRYKLMEAFIIVGVECPKFSPQSWVGMRGPQQKLLFK